MDQEISRFKPLPALLVLLLLLPILVASVKIVQRFFPKAAEAPQLASVRIHPGEIVASPSGQPMYLSAQSFDSAGNPIPSDITYIWGISSTNSVGNLIPDPNNTKLATFIPRNIGYGDLWVKALGSSFTTIASIPLYIGVPKPEPSPTPGLLFGPIDWMSRTSWLKAEQFSIRYPDQNFIGKPDPNTTISINLSSPSTLEVAWTEKGESLKLSVFYHFDKERFINQVDKLTVTRGSSFNSFLPNWPAKAGYPYISEKDKLITVSSDTEPLISYRNLYWHPGIYPFTDLSPAQWSWKHVQKILPTSIMPPVFDGLFAPAQEIARSDMALFLVRTYEYITQKKAVAANTPFTDIGSLSPEIQDAVKKIYGLKITAGTSVTTYSPEIKVNRAQMATFLSNLYKAVTGDFAPEVPVPFTDIYNEDIKWAQKPIARIYGLKVTAGISPTEFGPYLITTREQMATFIMNFIEATSRVSIPPFPSPSPSPLPTTTTSPNPSPLPSPPSVTQTIQTFSQLANQLISPPPTLPTSSPDSLPPVTIPPEASPAQANIFIQIINLIQSFFKQILGLP